MSHYFETPTGPEQRRSVGVRFWETAVSYTHLDVYKRQVRQRTFPGASVISRRRGARPLGRRRSRPLGRRHPKASAEGLGAQEAEHTVGRHLNRDSGQQQSRDPGRQRLSLIHI